MGQNWWQNFFDDIFADLMLERENKADLEKTGEFLRSQLNLKNNDLVFDQCCGTGCIANTLAKKGMRIIGVDQCQDYIQRAKRNISTDNAASFYEIADATNYITTQQCDAAYNWYTSFGYSESDEENKKMLDCVSKSLKPGGRFILDYTNPYYVLQNFTDTLVLRKKCNGEDLVVLKESSIDPLRGMFISTWTYIFPNGKKETKSGESKIYFPRDLKKMLEQCQFENIHFMGDLSASPLTKDSPRCLVIATKNYE